MLNQCMFYSDQVRPFVQFGDKMLTKVANV